MIKRVFSIVMACFLLSAAVFGVDSSEQNSKLGKVIESIGAGGKDFNAPLVSDANRPGEPNGRLSALDAYEGLDGELTAMVRADQKDVRLWLEGDLGNNVALAKMVERQVQRELKFLRGIAVEEKADKTAVAIDGLIAKRKEISGKLIHKMQTEQGKLTQKTVEPGRKDGRERHSERAPRSREDRRKELDERRKSRDKSSKEEKSGAGDSMSF